MTCEVSEQLYNLLFHFALLVSYFPGDLSLRCFSLYIYSYHSTRRTVHRPKRVSVSVWGGSQRAMAESARAVTGRNSAQKRNAQKDLHTDTTFLNKRFPSYFRVSPRAGARPLSSIARSPNFQPATCPYSSLEGLAESLNIPLEALEHLEALQSCEVEQLKTGLALGREGKLGHFEALSHYQEGKLLCLWEIMVGKNGELAPEDSSIVQNLTLPLLHRNGITGIPDSLSTSSFIPPSKFLCIK
jgi:hypothetical protein